MIKRSIEYYKKNTNKVKEYQYKYHRKENVVKKEILEDITEDKPMKNTELHAI